MRIFALHAAFFATGAAALVYEVLWMRRFTVLLGATAPATAATLSALFLGLALGSALFGRLASRARRPLLVFAGLEAGVGVAALLVEPLLWALEPLLSTALSSPEGVAALAARMAAAAAGILPPAILMGGTFPVLAQAMQEKRGPGVTAGGLYAVNTLGAAAGAVATPTVLLPAFGAAGSLEVAVATSLAVATVAMLLDATARRAAPAPPRARDASPTPVLAARWLLLAAAFFSGVVTLGLEVLGTRMLALVHESSVYSFATVLCVFLAGLGAGAWVVRVMLARGFPARVIAGAGWLGAGILVVATPALFHALTTGLRYAGGDEGLLRHEIGIAWLAAATILPAALLMGSVLPALMEMCPRRSVGAALGALLCANTLGAIVGPMIALFLLGPLLGLWWAIVLFGLAMVVAGEATLAGGLGRRLPLRLAGYAAACAAILLLRPGDLPRVRLAPDQQVVSLREGPFGTTTVVESQGQRRLVLNNHYILGGTASTGEERLQAHLPLLLHPDPRRVAFLGLGTGITASAVLFHPVRDVVAWELVGEVVEAARADFREANLSVLDDPRVRVAVEDARTGLRGSHSSFDVIVSDLVVPWRRGESALYTRESFESARDALAPDGVFCLWVPLFQLSRVAFDSIGATFLDVFPETLLFKGDFRAGEPAVALVGLTSGRPLDPRVVEERSIAYGANPDPANPYLFDPAGVWVYLVGALSMADPALAGVQRNTDRRPVVELGSPAAQFAGKGAEAPFIGEPLKRRLEELLDARLEETSLALLDAESLGYRRAGHDIWTAALLDLQGRRAEADALGLSAIARLPERLRLALTGPGAAAPSPAAPTPSPAGRGSP